MLRNVLKNSFWTGIGSVGRTVLNLAFAGLTIRFLGMEDAGFALLVQAVAGMNAAVTGLGFYTAGIRYVAEAEGKGDKEESRKITETMIATMFGLNAVISVIVFLLAPYLAQWSSYSGDMDVVRTFVGMIAISAVLQGISASFKSPLEAIQRYDIISKRDLAFDLTYGLVGLTFLKFYPHLLTLGIMQLSFGVISTGIYVGAFWKIFGYLPRPLVNFKTFGRLWRFGRWSYVNSLGNLVLDNVDRIVISGFFSAAALPLYSMAKRGYMIGHQLILQQSTYLFPMFAALGEGKREKALSVEPKLRWFMTALSVGFYSTMILAGPPALNILVGDEFGTQAQPLILFFAVTGLLETQSIVPWKFAMALDRPAYTTLYKYLSSVLVMGLMVAAGYLGYGLEGAAAASMAICIPLVILYACLWRDVKPNDGFLTRFVTPLLSPASVLPLVALCWMLFVYYPVGDWGRLLLTVPVVALLLPIITRFERSLGEPTQGVATLRRASDMVLERIPFFREPLGRLAKIMI